VTGGGFGAIFHFCKSCEISVENAPVERENFSENGPGPGSLFYGHLTVKHLSQATEWFNIVSFFME